jgi:lipoprotein signal peptidase
MLHIPYFKPVFNIADMAITFGVILIIFSYKQFFHLEENQVEEPKEVRGDFEG